MNTARMGVREPAVAGAFYPASAGSLVRLVDALIESAAAQRMSCPAPKGLIVPHAGYVYSGAVAASAFCMLATRTEVERVVLIGPSHYVSFQGLALPHANAFSTPLGSIPIDRPAIAALEALPQIRIFDRAHQPEHCLEVELPFLQRSLSGPRIVPLLVGEASDDEVAETIEMLWGGPETLFVVSSDLSHFLEYEAAQERDRNTARCVQHLEPEPIGPEDACGSSAIRGMLVAAQRRQLSVTLLDLRNSGDAFGPRDRVVGYGAFAFH